ncbi:MAG: hypothetical protein A2Z34_11880 [Planctomycetes bacterium RBG_16_59_8]|nr:MAG: hypothetical protein A2Z34_11880 [Planctomycetes bacterium RBG_16_59_8]
MSVPDTDKSRWGAALALSGSGMVLVAAILLGFFAGDYLDSKWETKPWLMVAGVLLGSLAGFIDLFRTCRRFFR